MFLRMNSRSVLLAAGSVFAAMTVAGCSHDDNPPPQVTTNTTVSPPATTGTSVTATTPGVSATTITPSTNNTNAGSGGATGTETAVADAVNKAIHNNAQMTGSRVTAVVNAAGEARLTGTSQNQQQKALAETTARQTSGVSSVINKIEIVPTGGIKSAQTKPVVKTVNTTKIIVVHDKSAAPGDAASAGTAAPGSTDTTTSTGTDSAGTTAPGASTDPGKAQ